MKKKMISLFLALVLTLSAAIPALAAQYVSDGYYGGSYYEIVDNCTYDMFSGTITCMDRMVQVVAYVETGEYPNIIKKDWYYGPSQYHYSTASRYTVGQVRHVEFEHYIDGNIVRNNTMYPS